jgi:AcrR family transcriptional regulator
VPATPDPAPLSGIDRRRLKARSKPSQAYLDRRRELIEAAARVMSRKGISGTTLNDIAAEAGSDRASVYYYVASKEELLADVLRTATTENVAETERIAYGDAPPLDKLRGIVAAMMRAYDRHYPYLYVWVYEDPSRLEGLGSDAIDEIIDLSQAHFELVREVVADGLRSGALRSSLPAGVLTQTVIGLVAWTFRWYEPGHERTAEQVADGLADLLLAGLAGNGPVDSFGGES